MHHFIGKVPFPPMCSEKHLQYFEWPIVTCPRVQFSFVISIGGLITAYNASIFDVVAVVNAYAVVPALPDVGFGTSARNVIQPDGPTSLTKGGVCSCSSIP
jgi:hypothetical protein